MWASRARLKESSITNCGLYGTFASKVVLAKNSTASGPATNSECGVTLTCAESWQSQPHFILRLRAKRVMTALAASPALVLVCARSTDAVEGTPYLPSLHPRLARRRPETKPDQHDLRRRKEPHQPLKAREVRGRAHRATPVHTDDLSRHR